MTGQFATAAYVAAKLPNVPTAERQPLADAATTASIGQPFSSKQVIDTLALASECFVFKPGTHIAQNSDGSGAAANGSPIGWIQSWVGSAIATQVTTSQRPTLTTSGASYDGLDDRLLWLTPAAMRASSGNDRTTYLLFKTNSSTRFEPYGTRVSNGGIDNTSTGWLYLMSSFAAGSLNYAYVGGGNRVTSSAFNISSSFPNLMRVRDSVSAGYDFYLNGIFKDSTTPLSRGTAETANGYSAFGWQSSTSFVFNGTAQLILGFGFRLSDSQVSQMDRFWNAYFSLGISGL